MRNARETVLLADHSKFEKPSLFRIVGFESVSRVVTDKYPGDQWFDFLSAADIDIVLPDSEAPHMQRRARGGLASTG